MLFVALPDKHSPLIKRTVMTRQTPYAYQLDSLLQKLQQQGMPLSSIENYPVVED